MTYIGKRYPHPFDVYPGDQFVSIVLTSYCRPNYLRRAIESIHATADMPFELIINDDGSFPAAKDEIYKMSDKVSTIIFNNGLNMGLNEAANRAISIASSKYVVFATDDCWFTKPTFKDLCNALEKPYIGFICAANDIDKMPAGTGMSNKGTRFAPTGYLGGGITQAFRKEVWKEVGGWDLRSTSGQSDNVFLFKILKAGYWKGAIEGLSRVLCANFEETSTYLPTAEYMKGNDCSIPKIFGIRDEQYRYINHLRREACQFWVDGERTIPNRETYDNRPNPVAGLNDIDYWGRYFLDLYDGRSGSCNVKEINWEVAKRHGQDKWKDQILGDVS